MPSVFACLRFLSHSCSLKETIPWNFEEISKDRFCRSEKDHYFLKIQSWQHKLVREYKQGKLADYFPDNAVKICSYVLNILENIEIKHEFQSKLFLHLSEVPHITPSLRLAKVSRFEI